MFITCQLSLSLSLSVSERSSSLCGNYQVDEGEQCDGGRMTLDGRDPCCTEQCQLKDSSECRSGKQRVCAVAMVTGCVDLECSLLLCV